MTDRPKAEGHPSKVGVNESYQITERPPDPPPIRPPTTPDELEVEEMPETPFDVELRDLFARDAMRILTEPEPTFIEKTPDLIATLSYAMADAMLKARGR